MRHPPADFLLEPWAAYGIYRATEPEDGLGMALLLHVDDAARITGPFWVALGGVEPLKVDFPAQKAVAMGGANAYRLVAETRPSEIIIRENMTTSAWWDLDER
jgi:hypothetical protein